MSKPIKKTLKMSNPIPRVGSQGGSQRRSQKLKNVKTDQENTKHVKSDSQGGVPGEFPEGSQGPKS